MRKEDKRQLPPRLKLSLPEGFHVERAPKEYRLYASYPTVDDHHRPKGTMTDLMGVFSGDTTASRIEEYAYRAVEQLARTLRVFEKDGKLLVWEMPGDMSGCEEALEDILEHLKEGDITRDSAIQQVIQAVVGAIARKEELRSVGRKHEEMPCG